MTAHWKKVAMLMLVGLLAAGPIAPPHAAAQMGEGYDRAMSAAQAALDKAAKVHNDMTMHMDSMMKMPMTANEKAIRITSSPRRQKPRIRATRSMWKYVMTNRSRMRQ